MNTTLLPAAAAQPALHFQPARLIHLLATLVLFGAVATALVGFFNAWVAIAVALVLTLLLKLALEAGVDALHARRWAAAAGFALASLLLGATTMALTAASLYERVFAEASAVADFDAQRQAAERELQLRAGARESAVAAMKAWSAHAQQMSTTEATVGGSCSNRPDTRGVPGVISRWRRDDATVANALALELERSADSGDTALAALKTFARPDNHQAVATAMANINKAIDGDALVVGRAGAASRAAQGLAQRRDTMVAQPDGSLLPCTDATRLQLIDTASKALAPLVAASPLARLKPGVDLGVKSEVTVRSWLRAYNGMLAMASFGVLGRFADDAPMTRALKENGAINRETLSFVLASLAELGLVLSTLMLRTAAPAPFASQRLAPWLRQPPEPAAGQPQSPRQRALQLALETVRAAARSAANLVVVERSPNATTEPGVHCPVTPGTPVLVEAGPIVPPRLSARQAAGARILGPWLVETQLDGPLLVLPDVEAARMARALAHDLDDAGQVRCLTTNLPPAGMLVPADVAAAWDGLAGPGWWDAECALFEVSPGLARILRWSALSADEALVIEPEPEPSGRRGAGGSPIHRSLRQRLAERGRVTGRR
jgi:hypothetical protein